MGVDSIQQDIEKLAIKYCKRVKNTCFENDDFTSFVSGYNLAVDHFLQSISHFNEEQLLTIIRNIKMNEVVNELRIRKPIEVENITISVNEETCKTKILKFADGSLAVEYIVYKTGETILKDRIYEHTKEIWQKAQQQQ